ncbi:uncharacterized protein MONOS_13000 [Monocercomonoides exilis]|uniref:uncharacterized protein n=1 Tax=Monocercomonoides exilis TaxID=2049356 RepID=UPI0035598115|nr:hypothetical protein MONOS_13000 [Monocercomonoides exilis]
MDRHNGREYGSFVGLEFCDNTEQIEKNVVEAAEKRGNGSFSGIYRYLLTRLTRFSKKKDFRKAMRAKGCGYSELDERKKQNFRRINVGCGEDWYKWISNRSLNNFGRQITEALYLSSLFGLTQSTPKKFCARSDERAFFHLISFDREAWAADLFQDSFSEFLLPLETEQIKKTELCAISTAPFASTDISVTQMTASFPRTLAFSFQSPL